MLGVVLACAGSLAPLTLDAQPASENRLDALRRPASSKPTITPIYGQLVLSSIPKDFRPLADSNRDGVYVQQSVPAGETADRWTEMITITGKEGAASLPGATPQRLAESAAGLLRARCPDSFAVASFGPVRTGEHDGFATVLSCGTLSASGSASGSGSSSEPSVARSETFLLVTVKGDTEMYMLQWAERGAPSRTPLPIDAARWQDRLVRLSPIRLCAIVRGEAPPFPSCTKPR